MSIEQKLFCTLVLYFVAFSSSLSQADNILTVHDPLQYGAYQGYIDTCILEIEPHGSYVEQTLILTYSTRTTITSDANLEIVHQFELPAGAVINDLWLWMPDTIMKAIVIDTWTAQAIYDSIVSRARDPAFLSKNGNQFKLQIYPLQSESYRKVRLNFITPTRWLANQPTATLPLRMLNASPAPTSMILKFRTKENIGGEPYLMEAPQYEFKTIADSLGYHFKMTYIEDISAYNQLNLTYQLHFEDGHYFQNYRATDDTSYFQLGLMLNNIFDLESDTSAHNFYVGVDLSGYYNNRPSELIDRFRLFLPSILRPKDTFLLTCVAGSIYEQITNSPIRGDSVEILKTIDQLQQSTVINSVIDNRKKKILYCDHHAATCWKFQGIESVASWQLRTGIMHCLDEFLDFDIVAAYDQGFESKLTREQADSVLATLNSFFEQGGHFLTFFDYNRDHNNEKVASSLIPGLRTKKNHIKGYIHGVPTGIIGRYFPSNVWANTVNELTYDANSEVMIEVVDDAGEPIVISKPISNGLLVVSGIWSFGDDDAQRATFGKPLLGLTNLSRYYQLPQLLDSLIHDYHRYHFDRVIIVSNSDTLISPEIAPEMISHYLNHFEIPYPRFHSINLIDGTEFLPLYVKIQNSYFYGNGYLLKLLADSSSGLHMERYNQDWNQIQSSLLPQAPPIHDDLSINFQIDNGLGTIIEQMEVAPEPYNSFKPLFKVGKFQGFHSLRVDLKTNFHGIDSLYEKELDFNLETDTTKNPDILSVMLANEKIVNFFDSSPLDTSSIVRLALRYHLLTDFTAMLCLEPNDTTIDHNSDDDENHHWETNVNHDDNDHQSNISKSSFSAQIYPNPFNESTCIRFSLPYTAQLHITIYNLLGQLVRVVDWKYYEKGEYSLIWDGTDNQGILLTSGIYFISFKIIQEKEKSSWLGKMILLR